MKRFTIAAVLFLAAAAARADDAAALFQAKCKVCHGADGKGTPAGLKMGAKDLTAIKISAADAAKVITDGKGKMTAFKGRLTDAEIQALAGYVAKGFN
jgi:cytochrome c6